MGKIKIKGNRYRGCPLSRVLLATVLRNSFPTFIHCDMNLQMDVTNRILPQLLINRERPIIDVRLHVRKDGIRTMHDPELHRIPLAEVNRRCAEENIRYAAQKESEPCFCYELFYRAFVCRDETAWTLLYYQFEPQVTYWVKNDRLFPFSEEPLEHFVNDAYLRMFKALQYIDAELFTLRFATLGALLGYLKECVKSSLNDTVTKFTPERETCELNEEITGNTVSTVDPVEKAEYQRELWNAIQRHLHSEEEQRVFYDSYVLGLKAPQIMDKYPETFTEAMQIFRIRARLLRRLQKDPGLWRYLG